MHLREFYDTINTSFGSWGDGVSRWGEEGAHAAAFPCLFFPQEVTCAVDSKINLKLQALVYDIRPPWRKMPENDVGSVNQIFTCKSQKGDRFKNEL